MYSEHLLAPNQKFSTLHHLQGSKCKIIYGIQNLNKRITLNSHIGRSVTNINKHSINELSPGDVPAVLLYIYPSLARVYFFFFLVYQ